MPEETRKLREFHAKYIQGTVRKAPVKQAHILVAHLAVAAMEGIAKQKPGFQAQKVYITTRALKHVFDARNAQEYDAVLENLALIVNRPDHIYENRDAKRGELAVTRSFIVKDFAGQETTETFFCSLQISDIQLEIATIFRFKDNRKKQNYLKQYKLMWDWEGD